MKNIHQVIDEIREGRRKISEECHHEPRELVAYLRSLEGKYSAQVEKFRSNQRIKKSPSEHVHA